MYVYVKKMAVSPFASYVFENEDGEDEFYDPIKNILKYRMKAYTMSKVYLPILKRTRSLNIEKKEDTSSIHLQTTGTLLGTGVIEDIGMVLDTLLGKRKVSFNKNVTFHVY